MLLTCLGYMADNFLASLGLVREQPSCPPSFEYAAKVAALYQSRCPIRGRVAEVGPGGSDAVARLLLATGADSVDLIDRFGEPQPSPDPRILWHTGPAAAAEQFFARNGRYDAILSCAVFEHLYDPLAALRQMAQALRPGGVMIHQIDLRDHGMFAGDPLIFLRVPSWAWRLMSRQRGRPNRVLVNRYRRELRKMDLSLELLVTDLIEIGEIAPAPIHEIPPEFLDVALHAARKSRPRLASEFRNLKAADLAVSGILVVATKATD